ncbi:patatin-like phospholipase family protein [Lederbergia sp. NSJ-179]|uniref:patatin-like phospholipase family protein n=1 Tax=Lederbergia sp. NSJ-179 TaxID=2931402 RepID=UPI001FD4258E|nr:patatin-like phospholipase family protein [Lederbergia sp. NSJ-179]MCJ7840080.1 patatin-like phospholipase family protein [Lederbergia sp. NSJ-179]
MKQTGLSLGGGSLRGVAHIGALKELVDQGITITHIAGTSAGSVVGGLYACGIQPEIMKSMVQHLSIRRYLDLALNRKGMLKGDRIYQSLVKWTDGRHFSDLNIPFAVICVDLISGEMVVIDSGEVALAIRASIAIPGIFSPVEMNGQLLVDGYILNNNPADIVRKMGAENVTSVRVRSTNPHYPTNLLSVVNRYIDIASQKNTDRCLEQYADLLIDIDLHDIGRFETKSLSRSITLGQHETKKILRQRENEINSDNIIYMHDWLNKMRG